MFDVEKAKEELRNAFHSVVGTGKEDLNIPGESINFYVNSSTIYSLQSDREEMLEPLKELKEKLELRFREYRIRGREKSLTSILAKYMQGRTLADAFGFKIITSQYWECYQMSEWIKDNFRLKDFDDRIYSPKPNGYRDLKLVVEFGLLDIEFIIQTNQMYADSHTLQAHRLAYPWKYRKEILELPVEYRQIDF